MDWSRKETNPNPKPRLILKMTSFELTEGLDWIDGMQFQMFNNAFHIYFGCIF